MKVIGTAGHVDHGKSTLVKALTGIDPDRLKEEKSREMTIELGFAWMELPDGEPVGIVDVPGHRDFIENMLAGVGGIDAVVFVIAADEGIMPQTREHLAILQLLGVTHGVIALTKTDIVDDPEWLSMVISDISMTVSSTFLKDAKIIPVSARNGTGIKDLIEAISEELKNTPSRTDKSKPRMSIDRVFTIQGFGTVVTGTLIDGKFRTGDPVVVLPEGLTSRIRGLQSHKHKTMEAEPGSRLAINLANLTTEQIQRGDIVTFEGSYFPANRFDAFIQVLPETKNPVEHNDEIKVFHLAAERIGKIRVLGKDSIKPGESGYVQIETVEPIVCQKNDNFIIRLPSPGETVGGGVVINPVATKRYKRSSKDVLQGLMAGHIGSLREKILEFSYSNLVFSKIDLVKNLGDDTSNIELELSNLITESEILDLTNSAQSENGKNLVSKRTIDRIFSEAKQTLSLYHEQYPLRHGMPREEFRNRLNLGKKELQIVIDRIISRDPIMTDEGYVKLKDHEIRLTDEQTKRLNNFWVEWELQRFSPPSIENIISKLGDELTNSLFFKKELIRVSQEVAFRNKEIFEMREFVEDFIRNNGKITVIEFRDKFNTSRKYALAFLEYLDNQKITNRDGDFRYIVSVNK